MDKVGQDLRDRDILEELQELNSSLERLNDKVNEIKRPLDLEDRATLAVKILDKFDEYMKNVDKLNTIVNELKGQTSIVRAAMNKTEKYQSNLHEKYKKACKALFGGLKETDNE